MEVTGKNPGIINDIPYDHLSNAITLPEDTLLHVISLIQFVQNKTIFDWTKVDVDSLESRVTLILRLTLNQTVPGKQPFKYICAHNNLI